MKIVVVANSSNATKDLSVPYYGTYGPLMVTLEPTISGRNGEYAVTHIGTGAAARFYTKLASARAAAKAWQGYDWDISSATDPKLKGLAAKLTATPEWYA